MKKTIFLGLSLLLVLGFVAKTVLVQMGRFMVPSTSATADVIILEGAETIDRQMLFQATKQICSGRANRLVLIMHQIPGQANVEAENDSEARIMAEGFGLRSQLQIIRTPNKHPITLKEASIVLNELWLQGVRSAIIMTDGFHERRSYLVYEQIAAPLGIRIIPSGAFLAYTADNWWSKSTGIYEFLQEVAKTAYYYLKGFIRIASLDDPNLSS
jgi:hypothetical protein